MGDSDIGEVASMTDSTKCVICDGELNQILSLPDKPVLMQCQDCAFVRVRDFKNTDYTKNTEHTSVMHTQQLLAITKKAEDATHIKMGDRVLDIGCGDGQLLGWYAKGITTVGIDPAHYLLKSGMVEHRIDIALNDVFTAKPILEMAKNLKLKEFKFQIITAVNVLHLVPNPLVFMQDIKALLSSTGVCVVQVPYFRDSIEFKKLDGIRSDYFGYYMSNSLQCLCMKAGLEFQGIEIQSDGSIRFYTTQKEGNDYFLESDPDRRRFLYSQGQLAILEEVKAGLYSTEFYKEFEEEVRSGAVSR